MSSTSNRRAVLLAVDSVAAFAAVFLGVLVRYGFDYRQAWEGILGLPPVSFLAASFGLLTFVSFAMAGTYRRETYWSFRTEWGDLAKGLFLLTAVTLSLLYLFKLEDVSRLALGIAFLTLAGLSVGARTALRDWSRNSALAGRAARWLIVGTGESSAEFLTVLDQHPDLAVSCVGMVGDDPMEIERVPWLGTTADLSEVLASNIVDEVVVTLNMGDSTKLDRVIAACEEQGKTVRIPITSLSQSLLKGRLEQFDGTAMWSVLATPEHRLALAVKRIVDVIASAALLGVLSPVLAATAVAILLTDGRPVLFLQRRGGLHGRPFRMVKFRTMVPGAEEMRGDLVADNERTGPVFKIADDPRVTALGRRLRKTSIDELPQLWNVLMGHMSLVGPRPQPLEEVEAYDVWHRRRLSMRPGITGMWQVSAREDPSFETWMDLDLRYIDGWSLWVDALILLKTPRAVLRSPGT